MKILLIEDDVDLLDITSYSLRREGYEVIVATDGIKGLKRWEEDKPDVVIIDFSLPRMSGADVCREIRKRGDTPVIFLTAFSNEEYVVQGFEAGADDYVTKPFSPRQLSLRIKAVQRRSAIEKTSAPQSEIVIGNIRLDVEAHEAWVGDKLIRLTPLEFRLLHILISNPGRVLSVDRLVDFVWGLEGGDPMLLKTHISRVRRKLELPRSGPCSITVVSRVGYRFNPPSLVKGANGSGGASVS